MASLSQLQIVHTAPLPATEQNTAYAAPPQLPPQVAETGTIKSPIARLGTSTFRSKRLASDLVLDDLDRERPYITPDNSPQAVATTPPSAKARQDRIKAKRSEIRLTTELGAETPLAKARSRSPAKNELDARANALIQLWPTLLSAYPLYAAQIANDMLHTDVEMVASYTTEQATFVGACQEIHQRPHRN